MSKFKLLKSQKTEYIDIALSDLEIIICRPDKTSERFKLLNSEQSIKYKKLLKKLI